MGMRFIVISRPCLKRGGGMPETSFVDEARESAFAAGAGEGLKMEK